MSTTDCYFLRAGEAVLLRGRGLEGIRHTYSVRFIRPKVSELRLLELPSRSIRKNKIPDLVAWCQALEAYSCGEGEEIFVVHVSSVGGI